MVHKIEAQAMSHLLIFSEQCSKPLKIPIFYKHYNYTNLHKFLFYSFEMFFRILKTQGKKLGQSII